MVSEHGWFIVVVIFISWHTSLSKIIRIVWNWFGLLIVDNLGIEIENLDLEKWWKLLRFWNDNVRGIKIYLWELGRIWLMKQLIFWGNRISNEFVCYGFCWNILCDLFILTCSKVLRLQISRTRFSIRVVDCNGLYFKHAVNKVIIFITLTKF